MKTDILKHFERQKTSEIRKENLEELREFRKTSQNRFSKENICKKINERGKELESKLSS